MTQENDDENAPKEDEIPINLTPEYTCNNFSNFDKANRTLSLISEQPKMEIYGEDPDVTQLEMDISSASISLPFSQSSNSKKRQLILLNENLDDHSIISDVMSCLPQNGF